jgi:hypothetical protein
MQEHGRLRIAITAVLVAGALMPALREGQMYSRDASVPALAMDVFRPLPEPHADAAKIDTLDIAYASIRAYDTLAAGKPDTSDRATASKAAFKLAFKADPTVSAANEELRRVGHVMVQRRIIKDARLYVLSSLVLLLAAISVASALRRFRHGSHRSAALLLVMAFALVPLAVPSTNGGSVRLAGAVLFARRDPQISTTSWRWPPQPAPAGQVWSPAAIEALRPTAQPTLAAAAVSDGDLIPTDYSEQSRWGLLLPSLAAAIVAGLASLVLRRLPKLDTWTPGFRRHLPTLRPTRSLAGSVYES